MKRLVCLAALVVVATLAFAPAALAQQGRGVDMSNDTCGVRPDGYGYLPNGQLCATPSGTTTQHHTTHHKPVYRDKYGYTAQDYQKHFARIYARELGHDYFQAGLGCAVGALHGLGDGNYYLAGGECLVHSGFYAYELYRQNHGGPPPLELNPLQAIPFYNNTLPTTNYAK